ncbi:hypothetical protein BDN72DRAFT_551809 [Pluteus cervinus]|uniref:Uncharacterized protein n=1 Tax=Pluteus cervinus TaxID=181527 RepID=A0ACD3AXI1_9AGAR|nr:hypothetical protein BDN72DRAFT_551809 [Pluteus cervinus]
MPLNPPSLSRSYTFRSSYSDSDTLIEETTSTAQGCSNPQPWKSSDPDSKALYPARTFGRKSSVTSFVYAPEVPSNDDVRFKSTHQDRFSRADLSEAIGEECLVHTTEIESMPCAGIWIRYGHLRGVVAWRFVVQLYKTSLIDYLCAPHIIGNFILDTRARNSIIAPEILAALKFKGNAQPGQPVMLVIQGIAIQCVVGEYGEASVLSSDFLIAGGLVLYFDTALNAPVLYFKSGKPPENIPHTVSRPYTIRQLVKSFIEALRPDLH